MRLEKLGPTPGTHPPTYAGCHRSFAAAILPLPAPRAAPAMGGVGHLHLSALQTVQPSIHHRPPPPATYLPRPQCLRWLFPSLETSQGFQAPLASRASRGLGVRGSAGRLRVEADFGDFY